MSTSPPRLTVALPTFNGGRHFAETLRAILDQSGVEYDLVICDDRSDDDTLPLARRLAGDRARIEVNPERLGLAGNWNRCAELARTPLLAIVHQDDLLLPDHLASHSAAFDRIPDLGMTVGAAEVIDEQGCPIPPAVIERPSLGPTDRVYPPGGFVAELSRPNPVRCSAVVLRRRALLDSGGFDPSYRYAVDWECWIRLSRRWPVAWLARPTVAVRWHSGSETHRFRRGSDDLDEVSRVLDLALETEAHVLEHPRASRRDADRFLSRAYLNRSLDALHAGDAPLARRCLRRALALRPALLGAMARDPRLAAQMAALALAPRWASRRFGRPAPADRPISGPK
ncbi:glycosyltransferase family 2 protein [Tautonia plasticadhaerens]|nr:glycosyltransferase [Tautonia plasticadhaerens]